MRRHLDQSVEFAERLGILALGLWIIFAGMPGCKSRLCLINRDCRCHGIVAVDGAQGPYIAAAELVEEVEGSSATFRIRDVLRGEFETNIILVMYHPTTLDGPLPTNAILVLDRRLDVDRVPALRSRVFCAMADDAERGILPDTPANRARLRRIPSRLLMETPLAERISQEEAIAIAAATQWVRESKNRPGIEDVILKARRDRFGWAVGVTVIYQGGRVPIGGGGWTVIVGDDRKVKGTIGSL